MIRRTLESDPILAQGLVPGDVPPLLSPLATALEPDEAAGLDLILEGFLSHHIRPRYLIDRGDRHVLAGDFCYATGLAQVARSGDVEIITLLAGLVSRSAGLAGDGRHELLAPLWRAVIGVIVTTDRTEPRRILEDALKRLDTGDPGPLRSFALDMDPVPGLEEAFA